MPSVSTTTLPAVTSSLAVLIMCGLLGLWLLRRHRRTPSLSYHILTEYQLIGDGAQLPPELTVAIDGQAITDLSIVVVRIANDGVVALRPAAWERPVTITFAPQVTVHAALVVDSEHDRVTPAIDVAGTEVVIHAVLVHPGDALTVMLWLEGYSTLNGFLVDVGIRGRWRLTERGFPLPNDPFTAVLAALLIVGVGACLIFMISVVVAVYLLGS